MLENRPRRVYKGKCVISGVNLNSTKHLVAVLQFFVYRTNSSRAKKIAKVHTWIAHADTLFELVIKAMRECRGMEPYIPGVMFHPDYLSEIGGVVNEDDYNLLTSGVAMVINLNDLGLKAEPAQVKILRKQIHPNHPFVTSLDRKTIRDETRGKLHDLEEKKRIRKLKKERRRGKIKKKVWTRKEITELENKVETKLEKILKDLDINNFIRIPKLSSIPSTSKKPLRKTSHERNTFKRRSYSDLVEDEESEVEIAARPAFADIGF